MLILPGYISSQLFSVIWVFYKDQNLLNNSAFDELYDSTQKNWD